MLIFLVLYRRVCRGTLSAKHRLKPFHSYRGAEIVAISIDIRNLWMHCVFTDRSLVVYDIVDLSRPKVQSLFHYHSTCVWDVKVRFVCLIVFPLGRGVFSLLFLLEHEVATTLRFVNNKAISYSNSTLIECPMR